MWFFIDGLAWAIGLLQLAAVGFLLVSWSRKYAFVFGYCLLQLVTSVAEVLVERRFGHSSKPYAVVFWTDEMVLDVLLFFILILLTYRAMEGNPSRAAMQRVLAAVTITVLALPFILYKGAFLRSQWFNEASQLLNFGAAILNLGLWTALLGSRSRDGKLLAVSAGFGIIATGVAVCFGLRFLIHGAASVRLAVNLIFSFAHLIGTAILGWAFRPAWKTLDTRAGPVDIGWVSPAPDGRDSEM